MARFTPDTVERVREAADIVEIVSTHTDLRHQQGETWIGLCPLFLRESEPNFTVNARDKLYYCRGCERGGDVIRFVQEKEGLEFPEAVQMLAERYGVEIDLDNDSGI